MSGLSNEPGSPHAVAAFGPFELNVEFGELRKHGVRVQLPPQPFQVLVALIAHPGDIVSREAFRQQLWPDNTFVDFEKGLNTAMNKLRQSLGDAADSPRYIETLPGRGYRFIAGVKRPAAAPATVLAEAPPSIGQGASNSSEAGVSSSPKRTWLPWALAALAMAGVAAAIAWVVSPAPRSSASGLIRFTVDPPEGHVTEPSGNRHAFALSPDGTKLAFTALNPSGRPGVWVRDFASLEARPVPGADSANSIFWSTDSRSLFFTLQSTVRRTGPHGGSYQLIAELPTAAYQVVSLSPDQLLISSRGHTYSVPASGGAARELPIRYGWPQVLPGGNRILHVSFDPRIQRNRARVASLSKPESATDLLESDSRVLYSPSFVSAQTGYLLYVRAGNLLAQRFDPRSLQLTAEALPLAAGIFSFLPTGGADFTVSDSGILAYQQFAAKSRLAWLDRAGRQLSTIGPQDIAVKYARLSPDGQKIAAPLYDVQKGVTETWVFDASKGYGRRLVTGPPLADAPVWSPDSSRIVYGRASGGAPRLFVRGIGEKDSEEPLPPDTFALPTDWSRDGRFVAYTDTSLPGRISNEKEGNVSLVDLRSRQVIPLLHTRAHEGGAMFSPDGRWIGFISDESGRQEVYLQRFEVGDAPRMSGERHLVSRDGGLALRWKPDGKELFYLGMDSRLYTVAIALTPRPNIGQPLPLFPIPLVARTVLPGAFGFDVSADGNRFLVATVPSTSSRPIVVVQNWELLLR